jgi:prepilin-type processing-associated H-X9-DG protein
MRTPVIFGDDIPVVVRTIFRVMRIPRLTLALLLALAAVPAGEALLGAGVAQAAEDPIAVGTELMATADVTLHKAEIAKGSKVSVTKLSRTGGQVDAVNVALADGHVVKVTMAQVHTYFRVVTE